MKILVDIGHPGQVHYFKHTINALREKGHKVLITARDKKIILQLLDKYNFKYINRGKGSDSLVGKLFYMLLADFKLFRASLKFKPDLFLSFSSPYAAQVSFLMRKPHIALTDTEHEDNVHSKFTYPFTHSIITPSSYQNDLGKKHIRFNNIVEGMYLNNKNFKQNDQIRKDLGISEDQEYIIIRFVSWNAHHDFGHSGLDNKTKLDLIELLKDKYKIFISSEGELPEEFKEYQIKISPEKMHDVLAGATIFIGESATMSSESTLLGTQSVYINSLPIMGGLILQENHELLKHFSSSEGVVDYVKRLIQIKDLKKVSRSRSEIMQKDFIYATDFLIWFIEKFPESHEIMKKNPTYQERFNK